MLLSRCRFLLQSAPGPKHRPGNLKTVEMEVMEHEGLEEVDREHGAAVASSSSSSAAAAVAEVVLLLLGLHLDLGLDARHSQSKVAK